jgi:YVTN family beta-propeller protein
MAVRSVFEGEEDDGWLEESALVGEGGAMRLRWTIALMLLGSAACGSLMAQDSGEGSLLVLSKHDHTLAIVDPSTLKVLVRAPVGEDPHEVIASADGRTAYVSNYGGGSLHTLAVIDLVEGKAKAPIDLTPLHGPHGLTFVGGKTWFTAEGSKVIGRFDPATQKVDWVLGTGQDRTHMVWVSEDEKKIVTSNVASGTMSRMELVARRQGPGGPPPGGSRPAGAPPPMERAPDWEETVVKVGNGGEGFDVLGDGKTIWIANAQDGTVSVVDFDRKAVMETLALDVKGANRLKFALDGRIALISLLNGPDLVIVDVAARKVVKRLKIGTGAAGIEMEPNGKRAFVACTPDNYVAVIDLKTMEVVGKIDAGGQPDGMAWASRK